jgi:hypothetical protein
MDPGYCQLTSLIRCPYSLTFIDWSHETETGNYGKERPE